MLPHLLNLLVQYLRQRLIDILIQARAFFVLRLLLLVILRAILILTEVADGLLISHMPALDLL